MLDTLLRRVAGATRPAVPINHAAPTPPHLRVERECGGDWHAGMGYRLAEDIAGAAGAPPTATAPESWEWGVQTVDPGPLAPAPEPDPAPDPEPAEPGNNGNNEPGV